MRKTHYSFLVLFVIFFTTSSTIKPYESKRLFEKIVFVELNSDEDSVLFKPFSKAWGEHWDLSSDISINGTSLMNYDKYTFSFNNRNDNLWTILHPKIIDGRIKSYYPYNPELFGFGPFDEGELRFPVMDQDENETFLTSESVRKELCYLLGMFGPMSDVPLVDEWGDYITLDLPDGTQSYKYPSPDYHWYEDSDITKYKLRVSVLYNKKGKEKKRIVQAICPVVNRVNESGEVNGEKELVWLNFEELEPTLKETYYFDKDNKSKSYLDYFLQKVKNADVQGKVEK